ncbi:MAG: hypothetical protein INF85_18970 [Roseomonas sp.]|nr:hypothetical protein [Roseomonas sp.]
MAKAGLAAGGGAGCVAGAGCAGAAQAGACSGAAAGLGAGCEPHAGAALPGALAVARCGRGVGAAGTLSPAMTLVYSGSLASKIRSILLVSEYRASLAGSTRSFAAKVMPCSVECR